MRNATSNGIPQVLSIVPVSRDGKASLKKEVKSYLGAGSKDFYLDTQKEVLLTAQGSGTGESAELKGYRLCLPEGIVAKLGLNENSWLTMIQRKEAVALKKMEIEEKNSERAQVVDFETAHKVMRVVYTNPMPEELLEKLKEQYRDAELKYDVKNFLHGQRTLAAWKSRKLTGMVEPYDEQLRKELIQERLDKQRDDGSWEGQVVLTARYLKELHKLEVQSDAAAIQKAVNWVLQRPQSPYNPGMFFLTEELVAKQISVIEQRQQTKRGTRPRFRELKALEKKIIKAGDDMILNPCGPRIMWPNALVLEALLDLGYEDNDRVQTALNTMMTRDWCECGYQHGFSDHRKPAPFTTDEIEKMERDCVDQYRYGGVSTPIQVGGDMPRISHSSEKDMDIFSLGMPIHIQGCGAITTRAMSQVKNEKMRRFAEAHLWRFAGNQHSSNGESAPEKYGTGFPQSGILQLFASYDHPVSKAVIMRAIPWIVDSQNEDGSWGEEQSKDASTFAVLNALVSLGDCLPFGLIP